MRIGIDARLFTGESFTGIARSVYENIYVWSQKYHEYEFYLFNRVGVTFEFALPDNWHLVSQSTDPWIINKGKLWTIFEIPKCIKKYKLDVYWGTNYTLPPKVKGTDYFVTIYDLALFKIRGIGERKNTLRLKLFTKSACRKSKSIIAISEATKKDVVDIMGIDKEKVEVSYCGGLPTNYQILKYDINKVNSKLLFDEKFFLFISTIEPRKNITTLVKAYEQFRDNNNINCKLVLAGKIGWKVDEIFSSIDDCKYKEDIILPGFITDNDKVYLLSKATAFIYPSLYEGFGIPILEAFAYSLPVITSNISSMPEVGGNAAFYINDPKNIDELSDVMREVFFLDEESLKSLSLKMKKQLSKFSWEKNADEIMKIFCKDR